MPKKHEPMQQEVEFTVVLRLSMPCTSNGELLTEEDYCSGVKDALHAAFKDSVTETGNSADAIDIISCREEAAIYHPTQEQAFAHVQEARYELGKRLDALQETLDM